jgi:hypothetical protein
LEFLGKSGDKLGKKRVEEMLDGGDAMLNTYPNVSYQPGKHQKRNGVLTLVGEVCYFRRLAKLQKKRS